jgi:hypothetical protein
MAAEQSSSSSAENELKDSSPNTSGWLNESTSFDSHRDDRMVRPHGIDDAQPVLYLDRDEPRHPAVAQYMHSSQTPTSSTFDTPLLRSDSPQLRQSPTRSLSYNANLNFISSPLNPNPSLSSPSSQGNLRFRSQSRQSMHFNRVASEDSQVLASNRASLPAGQRGAMILYRLTAEDDRGALTPPRALPTRDSVLSTSGDSIFSLSYDSKYPSGTSHARGTLVPYVYDPGLDLDEPEEEDPLHDPNADATPNSFPFRGLLNVSVLLLLILALLCLFIIYPVVSYLHDRNQSDAITGNVLVNATGQVPFLCVYHSTISWSFSFLSSIYYPPG